METLTGYIADEVFKLTQEIEAKASVPAEAASANLDGISDDDLMALLDDELAAIDKLTGDDE